jgi:hypothetical protein
MAEGSLAATRTIAGTPAALAALAIDHHEVPSGESDDLDRFRARQLAEHAGHNALLAQLLTERTKS